MVNALLALSVERKIIGIGLIVYFLIMCVIAGGVTICDKIASKHAERRRVRESTLLWIAFFGGAVPMYITMHAIRHKTKHLKFMLGIPLIIIFVHIPITFLAIKFFEHFL